jgi:UDP-glucose 4-epimerase
MNILITGAAGFIGSNLCDYLFDNGHNIIAIDNFSSGKRSNLSRIIDKIELHNKNIEDFDFSKVSCIDVVVHLAAQPSVPLSIANFYDSSSSNLLGTINVIEYCRTNQIPLIYASSSAVYGDLLLGDDESDRIDLLSPYATDKFVMELYAKTAYKLYQLSSVGLRFFNVYGPRQDPSSPYSGVISIFSDRMLEGQEIVINGGHQTRDFVYVKDVVDTIYQAIILASKNTVCEVSNVLTGRSVTIDYLADQMMDIIEVEVDKKYKSISLGDPEQSDGTVANMVRLFSTKIEQFTKLEKGLQKTVQHIKKEGKI